MKNDSMFVCSNCGYESAKWMGKCMTCNEWNTLEEVKQSFATSSSTKVAQKVSIDPQKLSETKPDQRHPVGIPEVDRVLGGGAVQGEVMLLGGEPGVGKSSLILSVCENYLESGKKVMYFSSEESVGQISNRAKRILKNFDENSQKLAVHSSEDINEAVALIESGEYDFFVLDSVQAVVNRELGQVPGSMAQVRDAALRIARAAKNNDVITLIIGHVNKEGNLAGPMMLSHIVDAVFLMESSEQGDVRILRALKNRFGSVDEVGIFVMSESGLQEVADLSSIFSTSVDENVSGLAKGIVMEGVRPLRVDVQGLAVKTSFSMPRRITVGYSLKRLQMLLAVLTKYLHMDLSDYDIFINIAGGLNIKDTALDLAVAAAIYSSMKDKKLPKNSVFIGEIGLSGEVRKVSSLEKRVKEAGNLGLTNVYSPKEGGFNKIVDLKSLK